MTRYTPVQRRIIFAMFYWAMGALADPQGKVAARYAKRRLENEHGIVDIKPETIIAIVKELETSNSFELKRCRRPRVSDGLKDMVLQAIRADPHLSIRRLMGRFRASYGTIYRILHDAGLKPYKIIKAQALKLADYARRKRFCQTMSIFLNVPGNIDRIIFSDECWFHRTNFFNSQNFRKWASCRPDDFFANFVNCPETLQVFCLFTTRKVFGPYLYQTQAGDKISVTGDNYRTMLREQVLPDIEREFGSLDDLYFQQDGASPHTCKDSIEFLKTKFGDRIISATWPTCKKPIDWFSDWPARSPDLNPLDFCIWGLMKTRIAKKEPKTMDELIDLIRLVVDEINNDDRLRQKIGQSFSNRLRLCNDRNGGIFKQRLKTKQASELLAKERELVEAHRAAALDLEAHLEHENRLHDLMVNLDLLDDDDDELPPDAELDVD